MGVAPLPTMKFGVGRILRHWIPAPFELAGASIVGADFAAGGIGAIVVGDCRSNDHQSVDDRGR